jgi:hypothetical protein
MVFSLSSANPTPELAQWESADSQDIPVDFILRDDQQRGSNATSAKQPTCERHDIARNAARNTARNTKE